ncbi:hypothetical protein ABE545_08215 [Sphingobacterium faecium]
MDGRLEEIEKQQSEAKDYSDELAEINKKLDSKVTEETLVRLKDSILQHVNATDNVVIALEGQEKVMSKMPQSIKVLAEHRLTGRQLPYIITGAVLVLVSVFSLFTSIQLWRSNSALHDGDIKTRMVRLFYPSVSQEIDSIYNDNPEKLKTWVKREEERLIAVTKAEENAKQSEEDAKKAKEEAKKAREKVNRIKRN